MSTEESKASYQCFNIISTTIQLVCLSFQPVSLLQDLQTKRTLQSRLHFGDNRDRPLGDEITKGESTSEIAALEGRPP